MKFKNKQRLGFSLVELVIAVVVIAIVMYAVIAIFITSGFRGVNVEVFTVAQSLAENKLEEAVAQDFDDITAEAETSFGGELANYSYEITVDYVSGEALDTAVGFATDYKRIRVAIRHSQLSSPTYLEGIRADY